MSRHRVTAHHIQESRTRSRIPVVLYINTRLSSTLCCSSAMSFNYRRIYTVLLRCSHKHKYSGFTSHDLAAQDTGPPQTIHHFRRFQFKNVLTTMLEYGAASSYLSHIHSLECNGPSSSSGKLFCEKPYTVYAGEHEGSTSDTLYPQHHIYCRSVLVSRRKESMRIDIGTRKLKVQIT